MTSKIIKIKKNNVLGVLITTRNNLTYLKDCLESIDKNFKLPYELYILDDASDDGTKEFINDNRKLFKKIITNTSGKRWGLTHATNEIVKACDNDWFILAHADMYFGEGFDEAYRQHMQSGRFTCGTRIEPPIWPKDNAKHLHALGNFPEEFKKDTFNNIVKTIAFHEKDKLYDGCFAPYGGYTKDWLRYGVDEKMSKQSEEETDLFYRWIRDEKGELKRVGDALVYHYGGRGDRFKTKDLSKFDQDWQETRMKSLKNFIRKWRGMPKLNQWSYPVLPKTDIKLSLSVNFKNEGELIYQFLEMMEPWFDDIILVNDNSTDNSVDEIKRYINDNIEEHYFKPAKIKIFNRALNKKFAEQINYANSKCAQMWIFHADVDEKFNPMFLDQLRPVTEYMDKNKLNVAGFPRINLLDGKIVNDISRDKWTKEFLASIQENPNFVNNKDTQYRLYKNGIKWVGEVHEHPEFEDGKVVTFNDLYFYHPKSLERQERQDKFYETIKKGASLK